jgi:hypothetical protein
MVGTLVLPILGAVPDGAIVLFSGLGAAGRARISHSALLALDPIGILRTNENGLRGMTGMT